MKAIGAPGDRADLAVDPLDASVVEARAHVLEDAVSVLLDRAGRLGEVDESAALRVGDPLSQEVACDVDLPPVEDRREGLLQEVAAEDRLVALLQFSKPSERFQGLLRDRKSVV